ncbi:CGNR zinc finger domain-containing protein [Streptomyces sp. NBC_01190]|uniref:CGNR zinc finger domain-containing protein n=1 Tax=Streptomyces sp. NBC_01190 TaxID=2903767 RepID=UPI00386CB3DB|nr:CGNR zinc finger domain-containing protein [Streptomyces sp. NBC_01190]
MVQHGPALFLADTLGLDFLNSIATPVDTEIDWIDDGDGLLAWLEQAELVPARTLAELREQALPGELDQIAAQARSLREDLRAFVREHRGRPLDPGALQELAPLNRLLARDEGFLQLVADGQGGTDGADRVSKTGLRLQSTRRWRSPDALLLPIGEALARFLSTEDFSDVKACEGPACTLMFVDHTRGRVRRWCSMAMCGNRAKQAAHRDRLKKGRVTG